MDTRKAHDENSARRKWLRIVIGLPVSENGSPDWRDVLNPWKSATLPKLFRPLDRLVRRHPEPEIFSPVLLNIVHLPFVGKSIQPDSQSDGLPKRWRRWEVVLSCHASLSEDCSREFPEM